jgi:Icc-related predicted phosphoesterase
MQTMRVLILSDIHGDADRVRALSGEIDASALVLVAGDFTDSGDAEELALILGLLGRAQARIVAVPGNCDRAPARRLLEAEGLSADGRLVMAEGLLIVGAGGGTFRTGLTPYERREEELDDTLERALNAAADHAERSPLVCLTHAPPHGTGADRRHGSHAGSRAFSALLWEVQPLLWACGHIHESRSVSREGRSLLVNPGPLREGCFAVAELAERGGAWTADAELKSL